MKPKLLILPTSVSELGPAKLLAARDMIPRLELLYWQDKHKQPPASLLAECEVIYGCPPTECLAQAPLLNWHHLPNAGIEPYGDLRLYANRNVTLTNARGVYGAPIAEHVLGMTLSLLRRLPDYSRRQSEGQWERLDNMRELGEARVLVLGLGDLGRHTAALFQGIGCRVWGIRRHATDCPPECEACFAPHRLAELLPDCDVVVNTLPSTAETRHIFNRDTLALLHRDAIFINVGRGSAVDHDALAEAIFAGRLWGAGLDVTEPEPLPPEHPLWQLNNVLITPHSSGASPRTRERNEALFFNLLQRYAEGRRLPNRVDFFAGY